MLKCAILMAAALATLGSAQGQTTQSAEKKIAGTMMMYPQFMAGDFFARNWMKTVPHKIVFSETAPAGIKAEPKYKGKPLYGEVRFGDDESAPATIVILDDDANKVYIDANQDGDLTKDGESWAQVTKNGEKVDYSGTFTFPANYKTGPGKYGIRMYRPKGSMTAWWQTVAAPTGVLTIDGKQYAAFLSDPGGRGIYNTAESKDGKTMGTEIFIDIDGDGFWRPLGHSEDAAIGKPLEIAGNWYSFESTADGKTITVSSAEAPPESKLPPLVMKKAGDIAPDFKMTLPDGKTAKLSDYKGRVVVLDLWATWCGPCQAALPHVEQLWKSVSGPDKNVSFIGLCVSDTKPAFDKWMVEKGPGFSFTFGFDPAGNEDQDNGQCRAWGVSGIPSTFVIDGTGKIVESLEGNSPENEEKLAAALAKLGVKPKT